MAAARTRRYTGLYARIPNRTRRLTESMTHELIMIAEDEPEIAEILDAYLTREGFRTYRVADGQAAMDVYPLLKPDLVLLDVKMPKQDGWTVLAELRRRGDTPVIMLTALDQVIDRLQGLRIGADDYIVKPFNPVEVVARIQVVLRRAGGAGARSVIRLGPLEINLESYDVRVSGAAGEVLLALTLTEFRLLSYLARYPNRVFSRGELVDACLPGGEALERTVDSHISNLRRKLERAGATGLLSVVRGVGYRLAGD